MVIYEPAGKAREYCELALNIFNGCDHGCTYCYARRIQGNRFHDPAFSVRKDLFKKLAADLEKYQGGMVNLCFMGDPYCRKDEREAVTRRVLEMFIERQVSVSVLTKGGTRCLRDVDLFRRLKSIRVGLTLTFTRTEDSAAWEPGAADPEDRLEALRALKEAGVRTWASFEPVIDPSQTLALIERCVTCGLVDEYKVGKLNHHPEQERKVNWREFLTRAQGLLVGRDAYFKKDLLVAAGV